MWTSKPPAGTPIDTTNTLCASIAGAYPMNEGTGSVLNDDAGYTPLQFYSGAPPSWTTDNPPKLLAVGLNVGATGTMPAGQRPAWPITFAYGLTITNQSGYVQRLGGIRSSDSNATWSCQATWHMSALYLEADWSSDAGQNQSLSTGLNLPTGTEIVLALEFDPNGVTTYLDGASQGTVAAGLGTTPDYGSAPTLVLASGGAGGSYADAVWDWMTWWSRALTPTEHAAIASNPWQIYKPQATNSAATDAATEHGDSAAWTATAAAHIVAFP
jgi:hypothetical protein